MNPQAKAEIDRRCRQFHVSDAERHDIYGKLCQFMEEVETSGQNGEKRIDFGLGSFYFRYEPFDDGLQDFRDNGVQPLLTEEGFRQAMQEAWDAAG